MILHVYVSLLLVDNRAAIRSDRFNINPVPDSNLGVGLETLSFTCLFGAASNNSFSTTSKSIV